MIEGAKARAAAGRTCVPQKTGEKRKAEPAMLKKVEPDQKQTRGKDRRKGREGKTSGGKMEERMLDLTLFDGEGGAQGAATAGGDAAEEAGRANPQDILYGKAPDESDKPPKATDTLVQADTDAGRRAEFERFIGENRDLYDARVKEQLDRRFKHQSELEKQLGETAPILELLKQKYGVSDTAALNRAIDEDNSYWEDEADRRGLTVEQLKEFKRIEKENELLRTAERDRTLREQQQQRAAEWMHQSDAVKTVYEGFDLSRELGSPETGERFASLLRSGIDVRTAYEVIHKDELLSGAIGYAVKTAQERTVNGIRARGMRPSENGGSGNGAAQIRSADPSKWSRKEREEVSRRVMRGEKIAL